MSRASALLAALTREPASTSEIYDRVGYPTLTRVGLISYHAFRAELAKLSAAGLVESYTDGDGSTVWRLPQPPPGKNGEPAPGIRPRVVEPTESHDSRFAAERCRLRGRAS
jgi:hypothetical protein